MPLPPEMQKVVDEAIERMADDHTVRAVEAALVEVRNGDPAGAARLLWIAIYARRKFIPQIEDLLDDPSFLSHPDEDPLAYLADLDKTAVALGLDLPTLIDSMGSAFERNRLKDIIQKTTGAKP